MQKSIKKCRKPLVFLCFALKNCEKHVKSNGFLHFLMDFCIFYCFSNVFGVFLHFFDLVQKIFSRLLMTTTLLNTKKMWFSDCVKAIYGYAHFLLSGEASWPEQLCVHL